MSLTQTIATLAEEIESQFSNAAEEHKKMLQVMKEMPAYYLNSDLAAWETKYIGLELDCEDELNKEFRIVSTIYEMASLNLHHDYDQKLTEKVYEATVAKLNKIGITISSDLDVSEL